VTAAVKRRAALNRRVTAVTQLGTVAALTSTGVVVGVLAHQAQVADALKAQATEAQQPVVVVAKPVTRPVRTVVVHRRSTARPVPAAQVTSTRTRAVPRTSRTTTTVTQVRSAPAPRATKAPAATKTTGS
jgi:hypothetical protein